MTADLRLGHYRDALADVACDVVLTDPPYTSRVEFGYRSGSMIKRGERTAQRKPTIHYPAITEQDARDFAAWATAKASRWIVAFNDHIGWRWLAEAIEAQGWYVFSPVVWVASNSTPRFQGDGPNDTCEYIVVARPRKKMKVGSLPGFYDHLRMSSMMPESQGFVGQKPLALMRALVRDYTRAEDRIVDPFAGTGSTLLAALEEGRHAPVGAEIDPATYERARKRLSYGYTPPLPIFTDPPRTVQTPLFGDAEGPSTRPMRALATVTRTGVDTRAEDTP